VHAISQLEKVIRMAEDLQDIRQQALSQISLLSSPDEIEEARVKYLGRKSALTLFLRTLGSMDPATRSQMGAAANQVKNDIEQSIAQREQELSESLYAGLENDRVDMTLPAADDRLGHLHPITRTWMLIEDIFQRIGFEVASGPEVEWDKYNFELLNMPKEHPARDTQDTFYLTGEILLRTQTSPVQIRHMESHTPPVRIIAPGRVYRRDYDMTHTPMFHQFEGLVVAEGITLQDLKGTCSYAMKNLLGEATNVRFRPHHFPFTEPSLEVDVSCNICQGQGCRTCKQTGWLEMAGAGMVHPRVLKNVNLNPDEWQGFAFGVGIDRVAMIKYKIDDIRLFYGSDLRFLNQF